MDFKYNLGKLKDCNQLKLLKAKTVDCFVIDENSSI